MNPAVLGLDQNEFSSPRTGLSVGRASQKLGSLSKLPERDISYAVVPV